MPVSPSDFDSTVDLMKKKFGEPKSNYPLIRARFAILGYEKHIDVFVINREDEGWIECENFTDYLLSHAEVLEKYQKFKESGNNLNVKDYYTQKKEFINRVMVKARK